MKILMAGIIALSGLFGIDLGQTAQTVPTPEQQQLREYVKEENIDLYKLKEEELQKILKDFKIELPTATINSITPTDTTMTINYDLLDPSSVLMHTTEYNPQIRAYENGTLAASEEIPVGVDQSLTLTGLTANTEYTVIVSGPYDLLGIGEPYNEAPYTLAEQIVQTEAGIPEAIIHLTTDTVPTVENYSSLDIVYDLIDDGDTLINEGTVRPKILLYKGTELVNLGDATVGIDQTQTFASLEPNTTYTVQITGQYDVDGDGAPDNTAPYLLAEQDFTTKDNETRPTPKWDQVYGGTDNEQFYTVEQTSDGGYIVAGYTISENPNGEITDTNNGVGTYDGLLVKFDSEGNHEWDQVYGGSDGDVFRTVKETSDGGYIVAGYTRSSASGEITDTNNGGLDGLLVKFDSEGNPEWDQVYGGIGTFGEEFYDVEITSDGGYIVAGFTGSSASGEITDTNNGSADGLVVKFDSTGNYEWDQVYGGTDSDYFYDIEIASDGGYIVAGQTYSSASGEITDTNNGVDFYDGLLVKFDNEGNHIWDQVYGGDQGEKFNSVQITEDGGYIVVGSTDSSASGEITDTNNGSIDGLIVKFDSEGNYQWDQVYGGDQNEGFNDVQIMEDGTYVVVGNTESSASGEITDINNGLSDGLLVKFDSTGNPEWDQVYGGADNDNFSDLEITSDGEYIVAGDTLSSASGEITDTNNGKIDGLLVKF